MLTFNKTFYTNCIIVITIITLSFFSVSIDEPDENPKFEKKGTFAKPNEFPHHVSVQFRRRHYCSGSLISNKHVLTPARCVISFLDRNTSMSLIKIAVGIIELSSNTTYDVEKMTPHPSYNRKAVVADVAVIRLKKEVALSKSVEIISLPKVSYKLFVGRKVMASDFGKKQMHRAHRSHLKKFTLYIVGYNDSREFYDDDLDPRGKFFAIEPEEPGPCLVDRGSPVILNKKYVIGTKKFVIGMFLGVYKYGCGPGIPYWFTDVKNYLDFIESEIARTNL